MARRYFNPRSPRGLRRKNANNKDHKYDISIHAAQEGCDNGMQLRCPPERVRFQSTQPKRAATGLEFDAVNDDLISIHAAQEGCDRCR